MSLFKGPVLIRVVIPELLRQLSHQPHIFEFWPDLSGREPREVTVSIDNMVYAGEEEFPDMPHGEIEVLRPYLNEINALWQQGLAVNPRMSSQLKPVLKRISSEGDQLETALSTYKISYWMKNKLSTLPLDLQRQLANEFCILNIGAVTVTSDGYVLLEQRPENVTAGGMLLSYPCGYLTRTDKTLEDPVITQSVGELGFAVVRDGVLDSRVKSIRSIGMQRESDEWSTNYVFLIKLGIPLSDVTPTKENKHIVGWPIDELVDRSVVTYSPTIKGEHVYGKLVPNTVGMLGLYILAEQGRAAFNTFIKQIGEEAKRNGYNLHPVQYNAFNCPFTQFS
ncbi:MAG: hypothetical protein WC254_01820 [Candidatus Woesearchaeota archaeon]